MDRHGRAQAVVVISPIHRGWGAWLRATWPGADLSGLVKAPLSKLAFIHVAHWSLITRSPVRERHAVRLPHGYIIFQSNFNDDLSAYVDAFALIVPWRMRGMWQGIFQFPGPRRVDTFVNFVLSRATPVQHYYCGYPDGSAREIRAALTLAERHRRFARDSRSLDDAAFAREWEAFLTANQELM